MFNNNKKSKQKYPPTHIHTQSETCGTKRNRERGGRGKGMEEGKEDGRKAERKLGREEEVKEGRKGE